MFSSANNNNSVRHNRCLFALAGICLVLLCSILLTANNIKLQSFGCLKTTQNVGIVQNDCTSLKKSSNLNCFSCKLESRYFAGKVKNKNVKIVPNLFLEQSIEEELAENIENQLKDIDLSPLQQAIDSMPDENKSLIAGNSFLQIVKKFISSEDDATFQNFLPYVLNILLDNVLGFVPYFAFIVVFAICFSLIEQLGSDKNKSLHNLMHVVFFSAIAVIVLKIVLQLLGSTTFAINSMQSQIEGIFPILLTLITAIGSTVTASTFQPLLAIFSAGISKLFSTLLVPIFVFSIVFGVVGNISKNVKLDKFSKFFSSLFNWIIGIVFTIFIAFLTIHGLTASSIDTISFKTAKFAIKSYVPMVGGYLSDGINVIISSSVLIKNAIGAGGLVLLFATIFAPIVKIVVVVLLLKLTSAILEPICNSEIPNFLFSIAKALNMLIVSVIAVAVMYLISVSLLMCCSNLF